MNHELIPQARLESLMTSLASNHTPKFYGNTQRYALPVQGRQPVTLVDLHGTTPEGDFVYQFLGLDVPTDLQIDQGQEPLRRGASEFLKDRHGREVRFRTLQPDGKTWKYSPVGKIWASTRHAEVIVNAPVLCKGTNSSNNDYERDEWYPVTYPRIKGLEAIVLNSNMSEAQKDMAILTTVKDQLGIRSGEEKMIAMQSGEEWWYDHKRDNQ